MAASVVVIASIFEPSQVGGAGVAALMEQATAAQLSSALGVSVEAKAVRKTHASPPPAPPPRGGGGSSSSGGGGDGSGGGGSGGRDGLIQSTSASTSVMSAALGAGIGAGASVAVALALALAVCVYRRRRRRASAAVAPVRFAEEGASSSAAAKSKGVKPTRPSLFKPGQQRRDGVQEFSQAIVEEQAA
ncbi:hypothetical protein T492DRAFT_994531 [Pavlovales sp. CCMP2436]|nr:hypothetical protein T492DRAFT_994531 [Pavlovales sp. CCMP2436]